MKWSQIRDLYVSIAGESSGVLNEQWIHLSNGYQQVCARLDVQEAEVASIDALTADGEDSIAYPSALEHIETIINITTGEKMNREPDGWRGRSAFMEPATGKPAEGAPQYWEPRGGRIWLRPTPDAQYELDISGKARGTQVTQDILNSSPTLLPEQYHEAIALAAGRSFLTFHPDVVANLSSEAGNPIATINALLDESLSGKPEPKAVETRDRRSRWYMGSFRFRS